MRQVTQAVVLSADVNRDVEKALRCEGLVGPIEQRLDCAVSGVAEKVSQPSWVLSALGSANADIDVIDRREVMLLDRLKQRLLKTVRLVTLENGNGLVDVSM